MGGLSYNPTTFVWQKVLNGKFHYKDLFYPFPARQCSETFCDKRTIFSLPSSVAFLVGVVSAETCHTGWDCGSPQPTKTKTFNSTTHNSPLYYLCFSTKK